MRSVCRSGLKTPCFIPFTLSSCLAAVLAVQFQSPGRWLLASPAPDSFGKYEILARVAAGGMAEVFKARQEGLEGFRRTLAIKRILPHLSSNSEFVDLLIDEAKVAGLLNHANIVQILDLGQTDGHYYIAMEYVAGQDLGAVLTRCENKRITLPLPHAVFIALEILKGLDYAHDREVMRGGKTVPLEIVHRDISPANILLSFQGEVKVTDFGIAKASVKALETVAGVVKGRYDYLSPEQIEGEAVDRRSDLFNVGVLLFQMLSGCHPFRQDTETATIETIRRAENRNLIELNPDIPYELTAVIERALSREPDDRFESAAAFKEALDDFFHGAGFIFSHSTLAAFLRGLFPQDAALPRPTRSTTLDIEEDDDEIRPTEIREVNPGPTAGFSIDPLNEQTTATRAPGPAAPLGPAPRLRSSRSNIADQPPPPQATEPIPAAPPGDDVTLIRRRPPRPDERPSDVATGIIAQPQPREEVSALSNDSTALRSGPGAWVDEDPNEGPNTIITEDGHAEHDGHTIDLSSDTQAEIPAQPEPLPLQPISSEDTSESDPAKRERAVPFQPSADALPLGDSTTYPSRSAANVETAPHRVRGSRTSQLLGKIVMLLGGLLVGYALGMRAAPEAPAPTEEVVVKREPTLTVQLPEGAKLLVNDREVPQKEGDEAVSINFPPGERQFLRVELEDYQPYERAITLEHNEELRLILEFEELREKRR